MRSFVVWGSLMWLAVQGPVFGREALTGACTELLKRLRNSPDLQPTKVVWKDGRSFLVHNREIAKLIENGLSKEVILSLRELLADRGTFKIHLDETGYVVASDERGSYSQAVWARDFARIIPTLTKPQRGRALLALLRMMTIPLNRELFYLNIRNSDVHSMNSEALREYVSQNWRSEFSNLPFESSMYVPHIRFLLDQLKDPRVPAERWNMKQNDALALAFIEALRGLERGDISWAQLDPPQESYFALVLTYAIRVQYWEMYDGGAWEEANARRTSSVGLMAVALEKFQESPVREEILKRAAENHLIPTDVKAAIAKSLNESSVKDAIERGAQIVKRQLPGGEAPERFENGPQTQRFADGALAHLLAYDPSFLTEAESQKLIDHLLTLRRDSGTLRYVEDVYLNIAQFETKGEFLDQNLHQDRDASGPIKLEDLRSAFYSKDGAFFERVFGAGFEAQWGLVDSLLVQALSKLIQRFPNSENRKKWESLLEESFARVIGFVTGEENLGDGPWAIDAERVGAFKVAEAWVPVHVYLPDGSRRTLWTPSKFTPLNWGTSELSAAFESILNSY